MAKFPTSYLWLCEYQATVCMMTFIGLAVFMTSAIANLILDNPDIDSDNIPVQYRNVYFFLCFGIIVSVVTIIGNSRESRPIILKVIFLNTIQLLIYVGLAIVSFEDYPGYSPVCIHVRCADMFWLRDAGWRNDSSICDEEDKNFPNEIRPDPYDLVVNKSKHELNQLVDIGSRKASKTASITYVCLCIYAS
ncbi:uncharacterized protein isoform X2 [Rhodnius prolixus]|uniref:uncharacterized protein isoform X2 n=1 Tax=Rhodnius prolixus TaxID=13249 RepID=UPI003D18A4A7